MQHSEDTKLLEDVAARLSDWGELDRSWVMATMISPNRAVTIAGVSGDRPLEIILPRRSFESVRVDVVERDEELGFAILALQRPFEIAPAISTLATPSRFVTLSFTPEAANGQVIEGELGIVAQRLVALSYSSSPIALAAPLVVDNAIVGMISRVREGIYSIIPMSLLLSLPAAVSAGLGAPRLLDMRALDASAADVIDHAVGLAMSLSRDVHMQHLLLALAPTGILNLSYTVLLGVLADPRVPPNGAYSPATRGSEHVDMPRVSSHVDAALTNAVRIAASRGAKRVSAEDLLAGAMQVEGCDAVEKVRALVDMATTEMTPAPPLPEAAPVVAGYLSDAATAENSLGFRKQAYDLCTVLATKSVKPPVSIGLFGDWGAGKSSFMKLMEVEFRRIEEAANKHHPKSVFCRRIVQLWFNAWHYIDDNLYAGITREIFEGLGFALATPEKQLTAEELAFQRRAAEMEEKAAHAAWRKSAAESADADRAVKETERKVEDLKIGPKALERSLTLKEVAVEVASFVSGDEGVKKAAEQAATRMNLPRSEAEELLANVRGTSDALRELLLAPRNVVLWVLLGLCTVFASLTFRGLLQFAGGAALLTYVGWAMAAARTAARFVADARKREAEILKRKQEELQNELERQKAAAKLAKDDAEAKAKLLDAARLRALAVQPEQRMADFVRERLSAWQKDSGVIAAVHRDFRELSRFLQRVSVDASGKAQPPIDRIVLYIDDLDRCPEEKVFEVLQAVHLLLAFDLFVVVVAVDSEWLLQSVRAAMNRIKAPENYLEKIFQIPYTLDAMPSANFATFVKKLTSTLTTADPTREQPSDAPESDDEAQPVDAIDDSKRGETIRLAAAETIAPVDPAPQHLTFEQHEVDFTTALYSFMSSPRNTKRFVNIYRLVRASLDPAELAAFRDAKTAAHEPAQMLIAVITNQHRVAPAFCMKLRETDSATAWKAFSEDFFEEPTRHGKAIRALNEKHPTLAARTVADFQAWLPRVARYSFEMGRLLGSVPAK